MTSPALRHKIAKNACICTAMFLSATTGEHQYDQQISDFAKTETGVNNSPTLSKRTLSTTVSLSDGELVLLGGLTSQKLVESSSGLSWLPKALRSSSQSSHQNPIRTQKKVELSTAGSPAPGLRSLVKIQLAQVVNFELAPTVMR